MAEGISFASGITEMMPTLGSLSGVLAVTQGGTGQSTFVNGVMTGSGTTVSTVVSVPVTQGGTGLASFTAGSILTGSGTTVTSIVVVPVTQGGTGQVAALSQYGVVYGSSTTAMAITASGTTGQVLTATTSAAPSWAAVGTMSTFTAGITLGGGSVTLTESTLKYNKIGNQVTITGRLIINVATTPSGTMTITGLPFTVFNSVTNYTHGTFVAQQWAVGLVSGLSARALINTTTALIYMVASTGGSTSTNVANNLANGSEMEINLTYFTA